MAPVSLLVVGLTLACARPAADDTADTAASTPTETGTPADPVDPWGEASSADQSALQAQLDRAVADHALVGAAMGVAWHDEHVLWAGASGLAQVETSTGWTPERSFRIGSVTKTFTAALVFLLQEDGLLTLDDPVEQWVPGYYDGLGVTLGHLMRHTSGIPSYNYVGNFDDSVPWTPDELVQWAVDQDPGLHFTPGAGWEYSNTNYVLLGMALQAASGQTYEDLVTDRLLAPLDLRDTYISWSGDDNPAIVDCYDADGVTNLTGTMDPSMGWAAGAGVSTPSDLARWGAALYGGDVLSDADLTTMVTQTVLTDGTVVEYGTGAFVETDGVDALVGHTGGIAGYQTYLYFWEADHVALAVMSNTYETDLRDVAAYGWAVPLGFDYP